MTQQKKKKEAANYQRTKMQEELVVQRLKDRGCRITRQRRMLLDIILREECASCKEIYYKAKEKDSRIGTATVYRMINLLEEIGAISRKNMYKISCCTGDRREEACIITLDDHTERRLSAQSWYKVIWNGLRACGYIDGQHITGIMVETDN
ncbi:MAG TPA: Fur family transcriptional regulator [Lachnospiraceae bacterium]|nr:Fur family transcriptional regulator [Lachnospiraceae bacterium]